MRLFATARCQAPHDNLVTGPSQGGVRYTGVWIFFPDAAYYMKNVQ